MFCTQGYIYQIIAIVHISMMRTAQSTTIRMDLTMNVARADLLPAKPKIKECANIQNASDPDTTIDLRQYY